MTSDADVKQPPQPPPPPPLSTAEAPPDGAPVDAPAADEWAQPPAAPAAQPETAESASPISQTAEPADPAPAEASVPDEGAAADPLAGSGDAQGTVSGVPDDERETLPPRPDARRRRAPRERSGLRAGIERMLPDLVKRGLEAGIGAVARESGTLKEIMSNVRLPKEIADYVLSQMDDTKNAVTRVVAKEIRDFLESTNFAEELKKLLTSMSFEIKTEIRFSPNEKDGVDPKVEADVHVRRRRSE